MLYTVYAALAGNYKEMAQWLLFRMRVGRGAAELSTLIEPNAKESTRWVMGVVMSVGILQSVLVTGLAYKLIP